MKTLICQHCGKQFTRSNSRFNEAVKKGWKFLCSVKCRHASNEKGKEYNCAECSQKIIKTPAEVRQTRFNVFCSKSCSAVYNNKHKNYGTRRSKLECYLEERLKLEFPRLEVFCNKKRTIGAELDFYFPELNLAIEINGILHFEPIYGDKKLKRIQEIDKKKVKKCNKLRIQLIIIDVSREFHLTQSIKEKHWKTFKKLVTSEKKRADYTNEQVSLL